MRDSQRLLRTIRSKRRRAVGTTLAVVRNPQKTAKGCCERYNTNDDEVGRRLAAAEVINENRTAFGCYQINDYMKIKPSSDEEGGTPQA